jgi:rod shape determining protein RodA
MSLSAYLRRFDWLLLVAVIPLTVFGLLTMKSLGVGTDDYFFSRQLIWFAISMAVFTGALFFDVRFFEKRTTPLLLLWSASVALVALLFFTSSIRGVKSWFAFGPFSFEPVEPVKLALIVLLAKFFSRRHVEMGLWRHVFISAVYAGVPLVLILRQPDLGSALILFMIWSGLLMLSGIRLRQFFLLSGSAILLCALLWLFLLAPYQKERVQSFLDPLHDPQGAGYQTLQAKIAVGSGGLTGKGIGHGTQSRLNFLPESETDFIFAAFAEEWGLAGITVLFISLGILFWRLVAIGMRARANFEQLFVLGVFLFFFTHGVIHIGMNLGMLPITGIGLPFMSYGGSLLVISFLALGLVQSIAIRNTS